MENNQPDFSIILVTYNSVPSLKQSLESLRNANNINRCEIILVDNNSTDKSIETAQSIINNIIVIKNSENLGFAKACNIGSEKAKGKYLIFYNPDLEIDTNALDELSNFLNITTNSGAVSGRMRFPDGSFQSTCRKFPNMKNIFLSRGSFLSRFFSKDHSYTLPDFQETTKVDAVAGTMLAVEREKFLIIGKFDERFFMYLEDTDLSYRLSLAGYDNYFLPNVGGIHLWGKGSKAGYVKRAWFHHISIWKYYLKHFPGGFSIIFLPIVLLGNFLLSILIPKR